MNLAQVFFVDFWFKNSQIKNSSLNALRSKEYIYILAKT